MINWIIKLRYKPSKHIIDSVYNSLSIGSKKEIIDVFGKNFKYYKYDGSYESLYNEIRNYENFNLQKNKRYYFNAILQTSDDIGFTKYDSLIIRRSISDMGLFKNYKVNNDKIILVDIPSMHKNNVLMNYYIELYRLMGIKI